MKEIYVIMRADHFQGDLFPHNTQVKKYSSTDDEGNDISENIQFVRSIKAYSTYEDAKAECERLQSLKDIKDVEYFIDAAKLVD